MSPTDDGGNGGCDDRREVRIVGDGVDLVGEQGIILVRVQRR